MKLDLVYSDGSIVTLEKKPPVQYYMHKEDREAQGYIRSCAPCPAVWVLKDDPHAKMSRQWQYYLRAINHNMNLENVYLLLDDHLAFANRTGFPSLDNPGGKADYFFNRNIGATPPSLDKVRTTSRSVLTGTEGHSLIQTLLDVADVARAISTRRGSFIEAKTSFRAAVTAPVNVLKVWVFDSRQPPPLMPGRVYPQDISEVNPGDYLYMPETNREKFLVANIVNKPGEVVQFPRGALYSWFEGGKTIASFMPHVANLVYGNVLYSLNKLVKLPLGSPAPSPYRHN
jgi:hypothetical protein